MEIHNVVRFTGDRLVPEYQLNASGLIRKVLGAIRRMLTQPACEYRILGRFKI
jgi:hypothetical protein